MEACDAGAKIAKELRALVDERGPEDDWLLKHAMDLRSTWLRGWRRYNGLQRAAILQRSKHYEKLLMTDSKPSGVLVWPIFKPKPLLLRTSMFGPARRIPQATRHTRGLRSSGEGGGGEPDAQR